LGSGRTFLKNDDQEKNMADQKNTAPSTKDTLANVNSRALANLPAYQPERVGNAPPAPPAVNQSQQPKK
jgi:hypothetical protein